MINALKGVIVAILSSLMIAIVFAYIFRIPIPIPIPMGGYVGPFGEFSTYSMSVAEVIKAVTVGWVFYGLFGGYILLSLFGAITGAVIGHKYSKSYNKDKMIIVSTLAITTVLVFVLSILDYIIGPW